MEKDRRGTLVCLLLLLVRFNVPVQAQQELSTLGATKSDVTVYWGQNSYGQSTGPLAQQPLATYCENADIDIIPMAFLYQLTTGQGGQPVINLSNIQNNCSMFPGTELINCPDVGENIKTCQKKGKKILISIGGATYTEGGFPTADKAVEAAKQIWAVFGPPGQTEAGLTSLATSTSSTSSMTSTPSSSSTAALGLTSSTTSSTSAAALAALTSSKIWWTPPTTALTALESSTVWWTPSTSASATSALGSAETAVVKRDASALRPFGDAVIDGFDFDFESTVTNIIPFATQLRALMDADSSKTYFLTAAPQCPFPDAADSQVLNSDVKFDAIWVQFYNNACGLQSFVPTGDSNASAAIDASSSSSSSTSTSSTSTSTASSLLPSTSTSSTSSTTASSTSSTSTATSTAKAQPNFNFAQWDTWAKTQSANKNVKVFLGVPADTTAAGTGYMATAGLQPIIDYAKTFDSFGGVMMWDASQAYANKGFLEGVRSALGGSGASAAAGELAGGSGQAPAAGSLGQGQIGSVAAVPASQQGFIQARGIHERVVHAEVVGKVAKFGYAAQGHIRQHLRHGVEVGVKSGRHGKMGVRWQA